MIAAAGDNLQKPESFIGFRLFTNLHNSSTDKSTWFYTPYTTIAQPIHRMQRASALDK